MKPLLQVEHLKKYFKTPKGVLHAVDDVSFTLGEGEILGVVGESGCGKSTLGRTVLHLTDSTDGKIIFDGRDITNVSRTELKNLRRQMQMVFQDPYASLDPRKSVHEIIEEPLKIYNVYPNRAEREEYVKELMDTVGLTQRMGACYPHELDGGRRQRAGIARALALNPKFIVCDEPVSALDVSIQAQILNLMQDLQEQRSLTYMFITHDLSVVKHIATHILVMYLGQVVEYAETDELFANPVHPYTKALLSAVPVPNLVEKRERIILRGEISSPVNPKPGCRFAVRCHKCGDGCGTGEVCLHEVTPGHFVSCGSCM
ncbi:MAG TPA: oligopeptide/dipeptide ABC transporter ATP-binding protein [Clostridia bacterium]|nr:oligopeptide/dipeptide ABC transporter ATP-binding protein [Clostridia bacterium]